MNVAISCRLYRIYLVFYRWPESTRLDIKWNKIGFSSRMNRFPNSLQVWRHGTQSIVIPHSAQFDFSQRRADCEKYTETISIFNDSRYLTYYGRQAHCQGSKLWVYSNSIQLCMYLNLLLISIDVLKKSHTSIVWTFILKILYKTAVDRKIR